MSAAGPTGTRKAVAVRRKPWLAALLSILTPGVGHLYNGQPRAALAAAAIALAAQAAMLAAATIPPEAPAIAYAQLGLLALYLLLPLAIMVHAALAARRAGAVPLTRYNRLPVYLFAIAAWLGEYQVYGRIEAAISASTIYPVTATAMEPTLIRGELLFAHRGYYADRAPAYGEVVALRNPGDRTQVWLLRIVALPGDRVEMQDGQLVLNGAPVRQETADGTGTAESTAIDGDGKPVSILTETLPGGITYGIAERIAEPGPADNLPEQEIPAGAVFLLGDNRYTATDSRILGPVETKTLESRPTFIFWSPEEGRAGRRMQPGEY